MISSYSTTNGICYRCVSSVTNAIAPGPTGATGASGATGSAQPVLQARLFPGIAVGSFSWLPAPNNSSGLIDYGNGTIVPWEQDVMENALSGSVPANGLVSIYSDNMSSLSFNTQPVRSITIVNAPVLIVLNCFNNKLVGCVDLRNATNLQAVDFGNNYINGVLLPPKQMMIVWLSNNLITQTNAESIATQLMSSSRTGTFTIRAQRNGVLLDITTTPFLNLIGRGWSVS